MINTYFCQIKKDMAHLKIPLLLWLGFLMMYYVSQTIPLNHYITPTTTAFINYFSAMDFLKKVLLVVLVRMVVQTDPVRGSVSWWRTRPISAPMLYCAKISLILVLFVGLHLLGESLCLLFNGVTPGHMALSLVESSIHQVAFIMPFILIASLTQTFSMFALVVAFPVLISMQKSIFSFYGYIGRDSFSLSKYWSCSGY